jgi:L-threonylcarbamoyladenylate synthase
LAHRALVDYPDGPLTLHTSLLPLRFVTSTALTRIPMMDHAALSRAEQLLAQGEVIGLPTETVYGLAADGTRADAVRKIFALKGRPANHPLILHLGDASWLPRYASHVPPDAWRLAAHFWPGPLSLVLPRSPLVPDEVTGGLPTVALRVPSHPLALELLRRFGRALAAPSANLFGRVSPTTRAHVLGDFGTRVPLVLDGGPCDEGVESTIVDLSGAEPHILRHGSIHLDAIEGVLAKHVSELTQSRPGGVRAPGMLASHYAPRARVELSAPEMLGERLSHLVVQALEANGPVGVIADAELRSHLLALGDETSLGTLPDLPCAECMQYTQKHVAGGHSVTFRVVLVHDGVRGRARSIYSALRYLDASGVSRIIATVPIPDGVGRAVQDRLSRAAAPRPTSELPVAEL